MCGWLGVIASNFLKIRNDWAVVMKYATAVVYVGTHFFRQFLQNSRSHSNAYNNVISLEKHSPIKWERDWWFSRKSVWYYWWSSELQKVWVQWSVQKKRTGEWKVKLKISRTSNLWLNIEVFKIFNCSFLFSHYFPVTRIALQLIKLFSFWSKSLWLWEAKTIDAHWKICTYSNPWQLLLYLGSAKL